MIDHDKVKLLFGPYQAPALTKGDRAFCLYRDCAVVITTWKDAPMPWPRCRPLGKRKAAPGLLVDEELARAVQHESTLAVAYWWGIHRTTAQKWRKTLGVTRKNNEGTHRLVLGAIEASMEARFDESVRTEPWLPEEVALLGTMPDAEVARITLRSAAAVGKKRLAMGRAPLHAGPDGVVHLKYWTAEEDELVRTLPPEIVAKRTGRSIKSVYTRRTTLGVTVGK